MTLSSGTFTLPKKIIDILTHYKSPESLIILHYVHHNQLILTKVLQKLNFKTLNVLENIAELSIEIKDTKFLHTSVVRAEYTAIIRERLVHDFTMEQLNLVFINGKRISKQSTEALSVDCNVRSLVDLSGLMRDLT